MSSQLGLLTKQTAQKASSPRSRVVEVLEGCTTAVKLVVADDQYGSGRVCTVSLYEAIAKARKVCAGWMQVMSRHLLPLLVLITTYGFRWCACCLTTAQQRMLAPLHTTPGALCWWLQGDGRFIQTHNCPVGLLCPSVAAVIAAAGVAAEPRVASQMLRAEFHACDTEQVCPVCAAGWLECAPQRAVCRAQER